MTRQPAPQRQPDLTPTRAAGRGGQPSRRLDPDEMLLVVKRLRRDQGQLGGIVRMIEEGRQCEDIVTQLSAVSRAVDRAGFAVIALGLRGCIVDPNSGSVDVQGLEKRFLSLA